MTRPHVLFETADRALLISDFRFLVDAGFDVAVCAGPGHATPGCPLLGGDGCRLLAEADVVVHALDPDLQGAAAIRTARPRLPVLVERPRHPSGPSVAVPEGCLPLDMPSSLEAQLDAVERAYSSHKR